MRSVVEATLLGTEFPPTLLPAANAKPGAYVTDRSWAIPGTSHRQLGGQWIIAGLEYIADSSASSGGEYPNYPSDHTAAVATSTDKRYDYYYTPQYGVPVQDVVCYCCAEDLMLDPEELKEMRRGGSAFPFIITVKTSKHNPKVKPEVKANAPCKLSWKETDTFKRRINWGKELTSDWERGYLEPDKTTGSWSADFVTDSLVADSLTFGERKRKLIDSNESRSSGLINALDCIECEKQTTSCEIKDRPVTPLTGLEAGSKRTLTILVRVESGLPKPKCKKNWIQYKIVINWQTVSSDRNLVHGKADKPEKTIG